jgi:LysR family transcriptional regulator, glycine cleavage system transcriptional activator
MPPAICSTRHESPSCCRHAADVTTQPPFDALVAFEAVHRLGSVTAAARDLGMTPSAVSHRLRRLEDFMGVALLVRAQGGMRPTPAGAALATGLSELLSGLGELRARCRAAVAGSALRVGVGAALADHWLVARLPRFAASHPGTPIELIVVESAAQASHLDLDVTIHWLQESEARQTPTQQLLFRENVFPVCHPRLVPSAPLKMPGDIHRLPLVHKGTADDSTTGAEWSWTTWFARLNLETSPAVALRCTNMATAMSAALQGSGVALTRSLLAGDALADGRLVRLLPASYDMPSTKVHLVRWPAALAADGRVRNFVAWLVGAAHASAGRSSRP